MNRFLACCLVLLLIALVVVVIVSVLWGLRRAQRYTLGQALDAAARHFGLARIVFERSKDAGLVGYVDDVPITVRQVLRKPICWSIHTDLDQVPVRPRDQAQPSPEVQGYRLSGRAPRVPKDRILAEVDITLGRLTYERIGYAPRRHLVGTLHAFVRTARLYAAQARVSPKGAEAAALQHKLANVTAKKILITPRAPRA